MIGLAQQLFVEREKKNPWKDEKGFFSNHSWPLLENLLQEKQISYVDLALAELLLKNYPDINESVAVFICHLSMAARAGHLCVKLESNSLYPDVYDCWPLSVENDQDENAFRNQQSELRLMIVEGAKNLPRELVFEINNSNYPTAPICYSRGLYYLQRYWILENRFFVGFSKLLKDAPSLKIDRSILDSQISDLSNQLTLEQREAIFKGCTQNFVVILGGPGTGKTFTAGYLIKVFWNCLDKEQKSQCRIALAAPTGKAAANLEMSIRKALQNDRNFPEIASHTLHSLLGVRSSKSTPSSTLNYDLLIVDESSMLDANLMGHLMASFKPGSRLIMLGDKHQLPPIEAGSLFSDLISHMASNQYIVELTNCLRTERQNIVDLAAEIKQGNSQAVLTSLAQPQDGIRWLSCELNKEYRKWHQELLEYALPLFPEIKFSPSNPFQAFQKFNQFRLLAPYRKGPFGVDSLNQLFFEASYQKSTEEWFLAPIMIVKNDYRLELFNGETGILIRKHSSMKQGTVFQEGDFALFPSKNPLKESVRTFSALLLPKFEYAYCLSVYKSQGSEFDHVLLLLPESMHSFSRELLYTAVTRARIQLEIWSNQPTLQQIICRSAYRLSGISNSQGVVA